MHPSLPSRIALSFDVEDWYHTPLITGSSFSKYPSIHDFFNHWTGNYDCLSDGFFYLLNLLNKHGLKATFFIVADVIDRYPGIAEALKNSDHEIACHSLYHTSALHAKTKKPLQSATHWEEELIEAKNKIEKTFQKKISGYRAPGAYFGKWMVRILEKNGFLYDSSIAYNSIYNKTDVPLKNIPTSPYFMNSEDLSDRNKNSELAELPWSYYNTGLVNLPAGGAFFYRILGNTYFKRVMNQCLSKGDSMFYIHPLDFSNSPIPYGNNAARPLYWTNKGTATRNRFEKFILRYKDKFTTCSEVYERLKQKEGR